VKQENGEKVGHEEEIKVEMNGEEEVRASSKAANLFAALAAEALEDEEVEVISQSVEQTTVAPATAPANSVQQAEV